MNGLPEDAEQFWAFEDRDDVVELKTQLGQGLISVIEFAEKIQELAKVAGLKG